MIKTGYALYQRGIRLGRDNIARVQLPVGSTVLTAVPNGSVISLTVAVPPLVANKLPEMEEHVFMVVYPPDIFPQVDGEDTCFNFLSSWPMSNGNTVMVYEVLMPKVVKAESFIQVAKEMTDKA